MRLPIPVYLLLISVGMTSGCKKEQSSAHLSMVLHHHVAGESLIRDTILYQDAAGNNYGVTRLQYYLSDIRGVNTDGSEVRLGGSAYFVDERGASKIQLNDVPTGNYDQLRFTFGIPSELNVYGNLPNNAENVSMIWPEQMGGGYHFMKFEGHFLSSSGVSGFAIHTGSNACATIITINTPFEVWEDAEMTLGFDLDQILTGPNTFDMDSSNYTMGIMPEMLKISENIKNAFTIDKAP